MFIDENFMARMLRIKLNALDTELVKKFGKQEQKTVSGMAKKLVLEALEYREDMALSIIGQQRDFEEAQRKRHSQVW